MFRIQFTDQYFPELLETINPNNFTTSPDHLTPKGTVIDRLSLCFLEGYGLATEEIIIILNGKILYGGSHSRTGIWGFRIHGWYFFQQFNNGVYKLITEDNPVVTIRTAHDIQPPSQIFTLRVDNEYVYITIDDPDDYGLRHEILSNIKYVKGHDILSNIKDERVHLYQFIEETITGIKEYQNSILKATEKISPQDVEKVKNEHFSYDMTQKYTYRAWLPLETAWQEYKKQHNITDEEVRRIIKEEEEKEKEHERAFKKQSKKW